MDIVELKKLVVKHKKDVKKSVLKFQKDVEDGWLQNMELNYVILKKCCKYSRRCVDSVCKTKTLKCATKRKCKTVKRAVYKKCFAMSKRKLKHGKGHCNIRSCCKFLRTCENKDCKSKKIIM